MPPPAFFPLRWESTGDHWWYASPIDWAAANGHYDMVRELLRLDGNHLMKLTSLRRIHRFETVWDDQEHFHDVAKCRSQVARKLLMECEKKKGKNSLIRRGYGGWLLYTAASAGDLGFVLELLEIDPLLVFGEGEYGVTDILYAAARSKNSDVFWILFDYARSPRFSGGNGREPEEHIGETPSAYKHEVLNRALQAAARGGNLRVLRALLVDSCRDVFAFRDNKGATILHAAAARGQVEVVKELVECYDIVDSTDNDGNAALHIAAARGQLAVVEALILASPSSVYSTNNAGGTFLHAAVIGFQSPCFRRLDCQVKLMEQLVSREIFNIEEIVNARSNDGRTALHLAIIGNIHYKLVELLMTVSSIDVNMRDMDGMTPLDILRQRPRSESSEILTRRLISAGGIFSQKDSAARRVVASHLRMQTGGASPGTSFRIPDPEMLLFTGVETAPDCGVDSLTCSAAENHCPRNGNRACPANYSAPRPKRFLHLPKIKQCNSKRCKNWVDKNSARNSVNTPIPLRQRFSKVSALPNMKRSLSVGSSLPTAKKKSLSMTIKGVLQTIRWRKDAHIETDRNAGSCAIKADKNGRQDLIQKCSCFRGPAQPVEAPSGGMEPFKFMNALFDQQLDHMDGN